MTLTYFGHSAFQIETGGTTLLVDPFLSGNPHAEGVVAASDLAPDALVLTHAHGDHWGDAPDLLQRTGCTLIAPYEITEYAGRELGHENVHPMNAGGGYDFEWGRLTQTWARHSSSFPDGTYGGNAAGYVFEIEGKAVYAAGDTDRFAEMAWYGERWRLDLALLPIGDDFTMGPAEAVEAAKMLKVRRVVPIHYGTFPVLTGTPDTFARLMAEAGLEAVVLDPGGSLEL